MELTLGKIVHYRLSEHDVSTINKELMARRPLSIRDGAVMAGDTCPAIAVRIFGREGSANFQVFLDSDHTHWVVAAREGTEPGEWSWPPRV